MTPPTIDHLYSWKPEIPHSFYQINTFHSILMGLTGLTLYILPIVIAYFLLHLPVGLFFKAIIIILMSFFVASGNVLLAIYIHEAAHCTLFKNRKVNYIAGIVALSISPSTFLSCTRFLELHSHHHKYFHTEHDPEEIFLPYANDRLTWFTLLVGMKNTFRYLLKYSSDSIKHLLFYTTHKNYKNSLFITECIFYFSFLGIQLYFMWLFPPLIILYLLANILALALIVIAGYASHAFIFHQTKANSFFPPWTYKYIEGLSFGTFLHLEHHAYPTVPAYQLPKLGRYLFSQGFYQKNNISLSPAHLHIVSSNSANVH